MDGKEIKAALKAAREAIRNKDYTEALKHCRAILKTDKNNYNALVFVAVAADGLDQPDQSLMAYKKATEVDMDNPLAWQGLCGFYEKSDNPEYTEDLIQVYLKLQQLYESDKSKNIEVGEKLARIYVTRRKFLEAIDVYGNVLTLVEEDAKRLDILTAQVKVLEKLDDSTQLQKQQMLGIYRELTDGSVVDHTIWTNYILLLQKEKASCNDLQATAERFSALYPDESLPSEIKAMILLDCTLADHDKLRNEAVPLIDHLRSCKPDSFYLPLLEGALESLECKLSSARNSLKIGLDGIRACVSGWLYLGETLLKLHAKHQTYKASSQGLLQLNRADIVFYGDKEDVKSRLQLCQARACVAISKDTYLDKAQSLCSQLLSMKDVPAPAHLLQAEIYAVRENFAAAQQVLSEYPASDMTSEMQALNGWLNHKLGNSDMAANNLQQCLDADPECSLASFHLGCVMYDSGVQSSMVESLQFWLRSAKLDPYHSEVFFCLGKYYEHVAKDVSKGSRCYQKAYELDADNDTAGAALIDSLVALGHEEKALSVLKSATSQASAGSGKWAWLRLGLYQLKHGDTTSAIMSLQSALRADSKDVHCWECLGEAYMARGSLTAALKAFTQATELDSSAMYCYYQMASIKQTLGLYDDAVAEYRGIVEKHPEYVPALKGLGETYLFMARGALKEFFHGRAVDYCQLAVSYLTKSASLRPDLSCQWKLLGDVCTLLAPVPQEKISMTLPSKLLSQSENTDTEMKVTKKEILAVGARCYGMAVQLKPECAALWHDLGVNYYHQAKMADKTMVKLLSGKSMQCLQKSVRLDPDDCTHWNALGVVAVSPSVQHLALAQHCFIKSIQAEANNVQAWTNLGVLYLKENNVMLAHEAFKVAQALEPSYVACWIGQALVAETIGNEESMDLFRHTIGLGMHVEGAVGYGHWVCKLLQDNDPKTKSVFEYAIQQMAAVPAASDALAKYTDRVHDDPVAYNMYGLLLERQGLYSMAAEVFRKAIVLLEKSKDPNKLQSVYGNYARVLIHTDPVEAVAKYKSQKLNSVDAACGLGLALSKTGQYEDSFKAYEKALEFAQTDSDKSHIHAALGMVAYRSGDLERAKGALFAGSQLSNPSVIGLQVLLGIGLVQRDATLACAVLNEIHELGNLGDRLTSRIDSMAAEIQVISASVDAGRDLLQKEVHRHPDRPYHWQKLARFLLKHNSERCSAAASTCIQKAQLLGGDNSTALILALSLLGAGKHSPKDQNNALSWAQKAVRIHPEQLDNWFVLLAALRGQQEIKNSPATQSQVLSLTTHLMARVEAQLSQATGDKTRLQALHLWCVKHYIIALMCADRQKQAEQFLQQASWLYENDLHLQGLMAFFKQDFTSLKSLAPKDTTGYGYQLLVSLYLVHGLMQETEKIYNTWLNKFSMKSQKLLCLTKLAHFAYTHLINNKLDAPDIDKWNITFKEACTEGLKLDPSCSVLYLMQGIIALHDKKLARFAKRSLHQVLEQRPQSNLQHAACLARQQLLEAYKEKGDDEAVSQLLKQTEEMGLSD